MKKGVIVTVCGILIIVTTLLSSVDKYKVYEKKKHFTEVEDIIDVLNENTLVAVKTNPSGFELAYSDEYYECLSKRKRLTYPLLNFSNYELKIDGSRNNKEEEDKIKENYYKLRENLKKLDEPEKVKAVPLVGRAKSVVYPYTYDSSIKDDEFWNNIKMDIVFIEEGEGWVIDYMVYNLILEDGEVYDQGIIG